MKKILIAISLFVIMLLFGCSAAMESTQVTTTAASTMITSTAILNNDLIYQQQDLSFTNVNEDNFMIYIINDYKDIRIFIDIAYLNDDIPYLPETIDATLDTLEAITNASGVPLGTLIEHSSTTLNEIAKDYDISLTVQDVVGFNDLKNVVDGLNYSYRITIREYLEIRLHRALTQDEISGIDPFYNVYQSLVWNTDSYDLLSKTADEFIQDITDNSEMNFTPTPEEIILFKAVIAMIFELND